jgi:single-strand DNA-binding protein
MLKASVIGNLGGDPELRFSASGQPMLRMNVASNYRTRTPEGEWQDQTEWVRVTMFGQRADRLAGLLKKGMRIYADGRLEARPWTDRDNRVRAGLELVANDVEFTGPRQADDDDQTGRASVMDERPQRRPETAAGADFEEPPF